VYIGKKDDSKDNSPSTLAKRPGVEIHKIYERSIIQKRVVSSSHKNLREPYRGRGCAGIKEGVIKRGKKLIFYTCPRGNAYSQKSAVQVE